MYAVPCPNIHEKSGFTKSPLLSERHAVVASFEGRRQSYSEPLVSVETFLVEPEIRNLPMAVDHERGGRFPGLNRSLAVSHRSPGGGKSELGPGKRWILTDFCASFPQSLCLLTSDASEIKDIFSAGFYSWLAAKKNEKGGRD